MNTLERSSKFDEETKRRALDMIAEYGLAETRDRMDIQWQTLKKWMKKAGIQQGGKKRYYDAETKQQALEMVDKIGVMATSKAMGISTTTLREWRKDEL